MNKWFKYNSGTILLILFLSVFAKDVVAENETTHVFDRVEITLISANKYINPYTDVEVWVELRGPGFNKRCYGYWDGDNNYKVRFTSVCAGKWSWVSGSNQNDAGLNGKTGVFNSIEWTENEKKQNPNRRGFVRSTPNGHALQYADGTPYFVLGDFFYGASSSRYLWRDTDEDYKVDSPEGGFKDLIKFRQKEGFNMIYVFSAFPSWQKDNYPARFKDNSGIPVRDAWENGNENHAQNMNNENGDSPFFFPGKADGYPDAAPDYTRINPAFFRMLDKKMDYAYAHGFTVFIETLRRDIAPHLKAYYGFTNNDMTKNAAYHYIRYIFARYQADPVIFGIFHYDYLSEYGLSPDELRIPLDGFFKKYGDPAFGQLVTTNVSGSTYRSWGHTDKTPWITMHQTGNTPRDHRISDYVLEMFRLQNPLPIFSQEPWYIKNDSEEERRKNRATMYSSLLTGALVGISYQAQGMTRGVREDSKQFPKMWEAITWISAYEVGNARDFMLSDTQKYQDLIPMRESLSSFKTGSEEISANWQNGPKLKQEGWSYCMALPNKKLFKLYFERNVPSQTLSNMLPNTNYLVCWFDPRLGKWQNNINKLLRTDVNGVLKLPACPTQTDDWALCLKAK